MRKYTWPVLLFACLLGTRLRAQTDTDSATIKKISDYVLQDGWAYNILQELCKTVGPRLSGSPGMYKAEQWGTRWLKRMQADSVYLQACQVPHWVRGAKEQVEIFLPRQPRKAIPLHALSLGNAAGTGATGIKAPLLVVKDFAELEKRKDEVNGKVVFFSYAFNQKFIRTFQGYGDAVRYRSGAASAAAKYGARAVLIRSVTPSLDFFPHTGSLRYNDSFPRIPAFALSTIDAAYLEKENGAQPAAPITVFVRSHCMQLPDTLANNVIGEIRGSEFPDEIITIGGHLDSWDPGEGAHDDGAGVVQSMEVINAFRQIGYKPKRTIRVVLFANEENGLRGGTKYAEEVKRKNEKIILAIETDAGGFTPRGFSGTMNDAQFAKFSGWKKWLQPYGIEDISKGGGGADIGPLNRTLNVPVVGLSPDSQRYFDVHHAASDVFETVNRRELHLGAITIAALVYLADQYGL